MILSTSCLETLASEMYTAGLINREVQRSPSFDGIIGEFKAAVEFMRRGPELEEHCVKCLSVFNELGGSFAVASRALQEDWINIGKTKCGLKLKLTN